MLNREVESKIREHSSQLEHIKKMTRSITDFNGNTDTEKFKNAMLSGCKKLYLEEGEIYNINSEIIFKNIEIDGKDSEIVINLSNAIYPSSNAKFKNIKFTDNTEGGNNSIISLYNSTKISFSRCEFVGKVSLYQVIRCTGDNSFIKVEDCIFDGCVSPCTIYDSFNFIEFRRNIFKNISSNIISRPSPSADNITGANLFFEDNIIYDCGRMVVEVKRIDGVFINRNKVFQSGDFAISLPGCKNIEIEDNRIDNTVGIEIGSDGDGFNSVNIDILNNKILNSLGDAIVFNAGDNNSIINNVNVRNNTFTNCTSGNVVGSYVLGFIFDERILNVQVSNNKFHDCKAPTLAHGTFENNIFYANSGNTFVKALKNSIVKHNTMTMAVGSVYPQNNAIHITGDNAILDGNILICNGRLGYGIVDNGNIVSNITMTNNRVYGANIKAYAFQNTSKFSTIENNYSDGADYQGDDLVIAKRIAYFHNIGLYINWGNPNNNLNPDFGGRGSLCVNMENGKLFVKESTSVPYWIVK